MMEDLYAPGERVTWDEALTPTVLRPRPAVVLEQRGGLLCIRLQDGSTRIVPLTEVEPVEPILVRVSVAGSAGPTCVETSARQPSLPCLPAEPPRRPRRR